MKQKNRKYYEHENQNAAITRRQFLGRAGAFGFSFSTLSPLVYSMLRHENAMAGDGLDKFPCKLIHIHLEGGWGVSRQFVPIENVAASKFPRLYSLPSNQLSIPNGVLNTFGVPMVHMSADPSRATGDFTDALYKAVSQPAFSSLNALTNTFGVIIPNDSPNDNTTGSTYGLTEAIAAIADTANRRPLVAHSVGLTNTPSGNGVASFYPNSSIARVTPRSVSQLLAVSQFSQTLAAKGATQSQLDLLAKGINSYAGARLKSLGGSSNEAAFSKIQQNATTDLMGRVIPPAGLSQDDLNPSKNAQVTSLLGLNAQNFGNSQNDMMWTAIYNTLLGAYAVCSFPLSGYDYHGNTTASTDQKDAAAGDIVGKIILLSRMMNRAVLIVVTSDGSVSSTGYTDPASPAAPGLSRWAGDDRNHVRTAMFLARGGTVMPSQLKTQLGGLDPNSGSTDTTSFVGNDKLTTAAILANWAVLNGLSVSVLDPILERANFASSAIQNIKTKSICFG